MKILDLTGFAFMSLRTHFLRSVLTALGIIFGVASVIAMVSIAEGGKRETLAQIEALGVSSILIESIEVEEKEEKVTETKKEKILEYGLKEEDVRRLTESLDNLSSVHPVTRFYHSVYARGLKLDVGLFGIDPTFLSAANMRIIGGRNLHYLDEINEQPVCIIGKQAANKIFRYVPPLGKTVWVGGFGHKVVGMFENPTGVKLFGGINPENNIFIPRATGLSQWGPYRLNDSSGNWKPIKVEVHYLIVKVKDINALLNTVSRIKRYLDLSHKKEDYAVKVPLELLRQSEATQRTFTIVMSSIAAISLLIGGIGIMNIMLANVYERKKEIGIQRALGSKRTDVLIMFLMETTFVSIMGGLLGIPVSFGITKIVAGVAGWSVQTPSWVVGLAIAISAGIGILFGTYPAWQAANISPIEALRNE